MKSSGDSLLDCFIATFIFGAVLAEALAFTIVATVAHRQFYPAGSDADGCLIVAEFLGSLFLSILILLKLSTDEPD